VVLPQISKHLDIIKDWQTPLFWQVERELLALTFHEQPSHIYQIKRHDVVGELFPF
jgi:hypothetical protein